MGTSLAWADPGWNPGLSEVEALAGPGRFFYGFDYGEPLSSNAFTKTVGDRLPAK